MEPTEIAPLTNVEERIPPKPAQILRPQADTDAVAAGYLGRLGRWSRKRAGTAARPVTCKSWCWWLPAWLGFQNRHDLVGVRIHDHDLLLDEDKLIPAPF